MNNNFLFFRNTEQRKAKSRDAARSRRAQEGDYFEVILKKLGQSVANNFFTLIKDLEKYLPMSGVLGPGQTSLDKNSVIRQGHNAAVFSLMIL